MKTMKQDQIRKERIEIVARMSITSLFDSIINGKSFFTLTWEAMEELEKFAAIFNYKQPTRSKNDGISYLRDFYYYLCK